MENPRHTNPSFRSPEDMLAALSEPFPDELIKKNEKGLRYVEGHEYTARLNRDVGVWSFRVLREEIRPIKLFRGKGEERKLTDVPCRFVTAELEIPGLGTRANTGVQLLEDNAGEDVIKGAETDALKRCCMLFGLGLHLYTDKPGRPAPARTARPQPVPRPEPQPAPAPADAPKGGSITDFQKRAVINIWKRQHKVDETQAADDVDQWLETEGLPPLAQLDEDQGKDIIRVLQEWKADR